MVLLKVPFEEFKAFLDSQEVKRLRRRQIYLIIISGLLFGWYSLHYLAFLMSSSEYSSLYMLWGADILSIATFLCICALSLYPKFRKYRLRQLSESHDEAMDDSVRVFAIIREDLQWHLLSAATFLGLEFVLVWQILETGLVHQETIFALNMFTILLTAVLLIPELPSRDFIMRKYSRLLSHETGE